MQRSHMTMQMREDHGTWVPQSSRQHVSLTIKPGHCLVGHFGPDSRQFKSPEILSIGTTALREFIQAKAGVMLKINSSGELVQDTKKVPTIFQGREVRVESAVSYLMSNRKWVTGILLQSPNMAKQLLLHHSRLVSLHI